MARTRQEFAQSYQRSPERIAYARPKLKEFGLVGALTQAGSDAASEMVPIDNPVCMMNPNAMC